MLEKVKLGPTSVGPGIRMFRMGKHPSESLESRDATTETVSAVVEYLLLKEGNVAAIEAKHAELGSARFIVKLEMVPIPDIGTIIHATHRAQDLLPAFYAELHRLDQDLAMKTVKDHMHDEDAPLLAFIAYAGRQSWPEDNDPVWDRLEIRELIDNLIYELDQIGQPLGYYFGTTEGDGSDFGFWKVEEDECATSSIPPAV